MVSAVASNPPPLVPGFSVGDVVEITFTKRTNGLSLSGPPVTMVRRPRFAMHPAMAENAQVYAARMGSHL